jgi:gamma-glutamyltranspeptidase / glutathione hydrolase
MQVLSALVDDGLNPQAALDRPRFCIEDGTAEGKVALEEGIPAIVFQQLEEMGHTLFPVSGQERALFGRGQVILRDPETGSCRLAATHARMGVR